MEEHAAWERFAHTGAVSDYLRYVQCRVQEPRASGLPRRRAMHLETDGLILGEQSVGGERPPGDGAHA